MDLIKPDYYNNGGFDVIEYLKIKFGKQAAIEFCRGNVIKYVTRFQDKNGIEDLRKAQTYTARLIELEEEKVTDSIRVMTNFVPQVKGVRVVNGTALYRCSYSCSCGDKGRRYIKEDAEKAICHKCEQSLDVVKLDKVDADFNHFIAVIPKKKIIQNKNGIPIEG